MHLCATAPVALQRLLLVGLAARICASDHRTGLIDKTSIVAVGNAHGSWDLHAMAGAREGHRHTTRLMRNEPSGPPIHDIGQAFRHSPFEGDGSVASLVSRVGAQNNVGEMVHNAEPEADSADSAAADDKTAKGGGSSMVIIAVGIILLVAVAVGLVVYKKKQAQKQSPAVAQAKGVAKAKSGLGQASTASSRASTASGRPSTASGRPSTALGRPSVAKAKTAAGAPPDEAPIEGADPKATAKPKAARRSQAGQPKQPGQPPTAATAKAPSAQDGSAVPRASTASSVQRTKSMSGGTPVQRTLSKAAGPAVAKTRSMRPVATEPTAPLTPQGTLSPEQLLLKQQEESATKIQAIHRGNVAREELKDGNIAQPAVRPAGRAPTLNQQVVLLCEVTSATGVPSVNTLGGADPYIEVRLLSGEDPGRIQGGDITRKPVSSGKTKVLKKCMTPEWKETKILTDAFCNPDFYVQLVLWDQNSGRADTAIGHATLSLAAALEGCTYTGKDDESRVSRELPIVLCDILQQFDIAATRINTTFWFYEVHKWKLSIKKGKKFPQMKTLGAIDSFVEARLCKHDPRKKPFEETPGKDIIWHKRTEPVLDNLDPEWKKDHTFVATGDPKMFLQFIMFSDATTFSAAQPLGCAVLPMHKVLIGELGAEQETHTLKFTALHEIEPPEGLTDARLTIKLGFELSQEGD